ncbi:MAG TPA: hypothetical protein VNG51_03375 [Ktedonobacteraceae bacterium]|nr:hypothetical protein [Ktedonobacteraceae bacterium]
MNNKHFQKKDSNKMVIAALAALANASTWEMTYQVLQTNAEILTSDQTFAYLCEIINMHRSLREIAEVENWNAYLGLLEDTRKNNVEEAWSNFITLQNDSAEAIEFFIGATREEKRKFLITDTNLLLSNLAFVYLRNKIEVAKADNDAELVELLEPHLHLLEDARTHTINVAWTNWENYM